MEALPIEVFGMKTPASLQRKRVKTALCDRGRPVVAVGCIRRCRNG